MKKLLALLLTFALVFTIFTACGTKDEPADKSEAKESVADTPADKEEKKEDKEEEDDTPADGEIVAGELPIVDETMTFRIMIPGIDRDPNEVASWQELEEKTNIHVEWDMPAYNVVNEKIQLMFASGDLLDAVGGWALNANHVTKFSSQGLLLPLEDMIDKTVNIKDALDYIDEARPALTLPDGHIYTLPIITMNPPTRGTVVIQMNWLEKVGMEMPTTTDELYEVLKAFQSAGDLNENGIDDEIPMSFRYNDTNSGDHFSLFGWFGYVDTGNHMVQEDREVKWVPAQEEWIEAVKYYQKLYEEGLLDIEAFTHDKEQYEGKWNTPDELPSVGVFTTWGPTYPNTLRDKTEGTGIEHLDEYTELMDFLPPVQTPTGRTPSHTKGDPMIFRSQLAMTTSAQEDGKDPMALMAWLDYIFLKRDPDTDAFNTLYNGEEGIGWEEDGHGSYKTIPDDDQEHVYDWIDLPGFPWYDPIDNWSDRYREAASHIKDIRSGEVYSEYQLDQELPQFWPTEEQTEDMYMEVDLRKLTEQVTARWVTGAGDIDAEYEKYLDDLESMGLSDYLAIQQDMLDAYYANIDG